MILAKDAWETVYDSKNSEQIRRWHKKPGFSPFARTTPENDSLVRNTFLNSVWLGLVA